MYLLINTISDPCVLIVFDESRTIHATYTWNGNYAEYETLLESIELCLQKNGHALDTITDIVVVHGPGGFTGMRVVALCVNSWAYARKQVMLHPIDFFTLLHSANSPYPYCIRANRYEYLVQENNSTPAHLISKDDLMPKAYTGRGNEIDFSSKDGSICEDVDYTLAVSSLDMSRGCKRISPLYIKKPNIS